MTDPAVLVEDHDPVRVLTLNRPERRNALDLDDRRELIAALEAAAAAPSVRALVLTGAAGTFCAGGDIRSMSPDPEVGRVRLDLVNRIARSLAHGPLPVVAAVEGGAHGLGLALATACDLSVTGRSAVFAASFLRIGLTADTGLLHTLPLRVGPARARALMLTARTVRTDEAERIGLVDEVVDDGAALARAIELADDLARLSRTAVAATRRILSAAEQDLESVLAAEAAEQLDLLAGPGFAEGRSAFMQRRPADFVAAEDGDAATPRERGRDVPGSVRDGVQS
ncbi:enoyl-CoA hydratase/isomerase family protein [Aeromicrobium sp. CF3.5]|uniref:enoyl-CoA hydratase/isomerase family protein n=1 Tax=Aeromicrobium sp. CF3.5 TaxID=3373078 RepID=UPI003EE557DA